MQRSLQSWLMNTHDVLVRGSGIVGKSLALSLARQGLRIALLADTAEKKGPDVRAFAMNAASVALLRDLKVWDALPATSITAVHDMHIEGDALNSSLDFSAWSQRVSELAWIVDAAVLEQELANAVKFAPHITQVHSEVGATLTALCEGQASASREMLGVVFDKTEYGHRAVAARLKCGLGHRHTARQWFRAPDVLALLPFGGAQPAISSEASFGLVWSLPEPQAQQLLALDAPAFNAALMQATRGDAGELSLASERASWPLMRAQASAWCGPGWVLLGDAAHVIHPLAGQGLNLGLADVAALTHTLRERETWRALGDEKLLRRYVRERSAPTQTMGRVTEGLLQLFAAEQPAVRELRNRGMGLVNQLSSVKRWLTVRALGS
jgi:2-polyprenyl-6-methoxyphenol hydroxylase-like FAD-dependent oxidoreductase